MARTQEHTPRHALRGQSGVTLIELMVSLAIGMFMTVGMSYLYLSVSRVFENLQASSRLQERVRFGFERITNDLRMAGVTGCSYQTMANVLNDSTSWYTSFFTRPVMGHDSNGGGFPSDLTSFRLRGDALEVLRADSDAEYIIQSHNPPSATITLTDKHDIQPGQIVVATDCSHAAVFQITNANSNNATLVHNTGISAPGNCTKGLGVPVVCSNPGTAYEFAPGSRLLRMTGVAYYIRANAVGEPALYRNAVGVASNGAQLMPQEILDGIEDFQVRYGIDTSIPADGSVDLYSSADEVTTVAPGSDDDEKWRRVLAVRVSLVVVSTASQQVGTQVIPYVIEGTSRTPTDRRLRKVFTTTVAIRNRL
jgi:type IV pilus assembly protein PilW